MTIFGGGLFEFNAHTIFLMMIGAVLAYTGIVIAHLSISIGVTGVVTAVYNANAFIHMLLSAMFLGQRITIQ